MKKNDSFQVLAWLKIFYEFRSVSEKFCVDLKLADFAEHILLWESPCFDFWNCKKLRRVFSFLYFLVFFYGINIIGFEFHLLLVKALLFQAEFKVFLRRLKLGKTGFFFGIGGDFLVESKVFLRRLKFGKTGFLEWDIIGKNQY